MIVLHFLPLNVDNLIHARPEACFSTICEVPSFRILNKRQGVSVAQRVIEYFSDGSSSTFAVSFDYPVQIEPDTFYTASAVLDGNELSYFGQEGVTEVQCGKRLSRSGQHGGDWMRRPGRTLRVSAKAVCQIPENSK
ncbi:BTB/POZ domain-containing protein 3-like isoform X1 [Pseudoliparis swirei]|uniref:BTB/POZ domain-containing protein 3-like isoform X1 n=1 Tax=Pseudoliparis swirei TaxID=2059687 RepID=UPI0024BE2B0B|nr:BTB/POZ domain-containing protein 3-like isoform X1 [Pseudoliparis swirei]XP_056266713.1 BTB/POZ domain-containing protein 3-like isoform X1 [Pseudoliparis swirei]XP_056266714.1 BTB/POZ domain-containing protein 3-like isoform X1 [Pseudoliparis swirei]XP_056266715.1 BTB/POZ domain-containing protein 3-like isoform X1 [Pseudoliparis swirei]